MTKQYLDKLTYNVLGCCINVHKEIGPGLLESVYHKCLKAELKHHKIKFESELYVPVNYRDVEIETQLRADFYIENCLVLEIKAVDGLLPIHEAQLMTYLKLLNSPKGLLVNFNSVNIFHHGQKTIVTEDFRNLPD